jgi:hypothetical protein
MFQLIVSIPAYKKVKLSLFVSRPLSHIRLLLTAFGAKIQRQAPAVDRVGGGVEKEMKRRHDLDVFFFLYVLEKLLC